MSTTIATTRSTTGLGHDRRVTTLVVDVLTEPVRARTWKEVGYVLASFPVGTVTFAVAATGLALGLGLSFTLVGIPLLTATLWAADHAARFECWRAGWIGACVRPTDPPAACGSPWWSVAGVWARLARASGWKRIGYFVALLPLSVATSTLVITSWSFGLAATTMPFWNWTVDDGSTRLLGYVATRPLDYVPIVAVGLAALLASPWLTRAATRAHVALAGVLLV